MKKGNKEKREREEGNAREDGIRGRKKENRSKKERTEGAIRTGKREVKWMG